MRYTDSNQNKRSAKSLNEYGHVRVEVSCWETDKTNVLLYLYLCSKKSPRDVSVLNFRLFSRIKNLPNFH